MSTLRLARLTQLRPFRVCVSVCVYVTFQFVQGHRNGLRQPTLYKQEGDQGHSHTHTYTTT